VQITRRSLYNVIAGPCSAPPTPLCHVPPNQSSTIALILRIVHLTRCVDLSSQSDFSSDHWKNFPLGSSCSCSCRLGTRQPQHEELGRLALGRGMGSDRHPAMRHTSCTAILSWPGLIGPHGPSGSFSTEPFDGCSRKSLRRSPGSD
jgi:hypothetical protein